MLKLLLRWSPAAVLGLFLFFAVRSGLPFAHLLLALAAVALTQTLPGVMIWRIVRSRAGWWIEDLVAGTAVGACIAVGAQVAAGSLGVPAMSWAPGVVVAGLLLALPWTRQRLVNASTVRLSPAWNGAVSAATALLLIPTQRFYRQVPVTWSEGFRQLPTDLHFHLALTGQLAHRGPQEVPWVASEPLSYHWFSHAWIAQIAQTSSVPLDQVLLRFGPPVLAVALVLGVAVLSVRISGRAWAGPLGSLIAVGSVDVNVFGGPSDFTAGKLLTPSALSLEFSSVLVVSLVALLAMRWRRLADPQLSSFVVVLLAFCAVGAKGSALPIVLAGMALALTLCLVSRDDRRSLIATDVAVVAVCLLVALRVLFRGSANIRLAPVDALSEAGISAYLLQGIEDPGLLLPLFGAVLVLVSVLSRSAGLFAALTIPSVRTSPIVALLTGAALAGAGAVLLLSAGGKSQYYFLRNAVPLMSVGSAVGLTALWDHLGRGQRRGLIFGTGVLAGLLFLVFQGYAFLDPDTSTLELVPRAVSHSVVLVAVVAVATFGAIRIADQAEASRAQIAAVVAGVALVLASVAPGVLREFQRPLPDHPPGVEPTERFSLSRDQIEAARWLRDHSSPDSMVMTNRHCASPVWENCDPRRFAIAAYTERRVLLEGWAYTASWKQSPDGAAGRHYKPFWDPELQKLNDDFLESPTEARAEELRERGVKWIYVDKTAPFSGDLSAFARPRFETEWAWVLEFPDEPGR